jgi:hypothetical protein
MTTSSNTNQSAVQNQKTAINKSKKNNIAKKDVLSTSKKEDSLKVNRSQNIRTLATSSEPEDNLFDSEYDLGGGD